MHQSLKSAAPGKRALLHNNKSLCNNILAESFNYEVLYSCLQKFNCDFITALSRAVDLLPVVTNMLLNLFMFPTDTRAFLYIFMSFYDKVFAAECVTLT